MKQINIHAAKTHLSSLVERAAAGESFIIAKSGKPLVVVIPYEAPKQSPRSGFLSGRISVPADFNSMGAESIEKLFVGQS